MIALATSLPQLAATKGAQTAQLLTDLGSVTSSLAGAQQAAQTGVNEMTPGARGYHSLSTFSGAVTAAHSAAVRAQTACQPPASNPCAAQIQAINHNIKVANRAGRNLNALT